MLKLVIEYVGAENRVYALTTRRRHFGVAPSEESGIKYRLSRAAPLLRLECHFRRVSAYNGNLEWLRAAS